MSNNNDQEFYADPQLKALIEVMKDITTSRVPLLEPHELAARSTLQNLQHQIDDHNALDHGELIDVLYQARIEVKYLCTIITDLKKSIAERETEIARLERLAAR